MIAAQQYYIEYGNDLNEERLFNLIPNYIPDYCLQRDNAIEMWHHLVLQAYKKVMQNKNRILQCWKKSLINVSFYKLFFEKFSNM